MLPVFRRFNSSAKTAAEPAENLRRLSYKYDGAHRS